MINNLDNMKIKKFNENRTEAGLMEIIEYIKEDSSMSEFDITGDTLSEYWIIKIFSGHFYKRSIDDVLELQLKMSNKILDISKHYHIHSSEIEIYNKGDYYISADIVLK